MTRISAEPQETAAASRTNSQWLEITVAAPPDSAEAAAAALLEAGSPGVAEAAGDPGRLVACLPPGTSTEAILQDLEAAFRRIEEAGLGRPAVVASRWLDEADWANAWKQAYHPLRVGRRLVIKPSWEPYAADPQELVVELDPGMAFGTGSHPTTRLCLGALEDYVHPGDTVADIGTGSGILAMASALLGAGRVYATDIDPLPRKVAQQNAASAGLADRVSVLEPEPFFEAARNCSIVVANILADTVIELTPRVASMLRPQGLFIASGIVADRMDDVTRALGDACFRILEERADDVWRAVVAERLGTPYPE